MTKKRDVPRVYWDSSCFIAWLLPEPERRPQCLEVIDAARRSDLQIVTSVLSLVEVARLDRGPVLVTQKNQNKISDFFKNPWIIVVQMRRRVAEMARVLVWEHNLKPRDAMHAATAIYGLESGRVEEMHSFDGHYRRLARAGILRVTEPRALQTLIPMLAPEPDGEEDEDGGAN